MLHPVQNIQQPELPEERSPWERALCVVCGSWFYPPPTYDWEPARIGRCPEKMACFIDSMYDQEKFDIGQRALGLLV